MTIYNLDLRDVPKIPSFIKFFSIYFILFAFFTLYSYFFTTASIYNVYGWEADRGSLSGIGIVLIYLFKGFLGYGFLKGKKWSVPVGIVDGIVGIVIYFVATTLPFITFDPNFPNKREIGADILFLIPYLYCLIKLQRE